MNILKTMTLTAVMGLVAMSASVQADPVSDLPSGTYTLDKTHASITWKVSHFGLSNYTGRFKDFDAELNLDTQKVENSSVKTTINVSSIETDYPNPEKTDFNKELSDGEEWFNGAKFPDITFTSSSLTMTSDTEGTLQGELTLLGVSKPLTLDVTFNNAMVKHPFAGKPAIGFSATGVVKRTEWGLSKFAPNVGDDVTLLIEAEFFGG